MRVTAQITGFVRRNRSPARAAATAGSAASPLLEEQVGRGRPLLAPAAALDGDAPDRERGQDRAATEHGPAAPGDERAVGRQGLLLDLVVGLARGGPAAAGGLDRQSNALNPRH